MSRATSLTRLTTLLGALAGITAGAGKVHDRIRDDLDLADAETDLIGSAGINSWECELVEEWEHQGASGYNRATGRFRIVATYFKDDAAGSFNALTALIGLAAAAIIDPATGFPQIDADGVRVEGPVITKTRTDHGVYRAVLTFRTWDLTTT